MAKFVARGGEVDSRTVDLVTSDVAPKRGRGRPSTGEAKTNAERQKAYRERRRAEGKEVVTLVLPSESVQGLKQFTKFKDITPGSVVGKLIQGQLLRKRSGAKR